MSKVAIVGAGLIGRAWAITFARAGHEIALTDADSEAPAAAVDFISGIATDLDRNDLLGGATPDELVARIHPTDDLAEALSGAVYLQENTPEKVEVKKTVYAELDRLAGPDCLIGSSTSGILPSAFTEELEGRHRCFVAHPINPPYLVPAVELCPAPWTSEDVMARAAAFLRKAGQAPIVMKREIDGFIMNRMQGALLDEAVRLVADGYASTEDIDIGIREGLALRWSFMGPFETIDLNAPQGVRDYVERYYGLYQKIFAGMHEVDWRGDLLDSIEAQRRERLSTDSLSERQAWRDRRLMALAAHKRKAAKDLGE